MRMAEAVGAGMMPSGRVAFEADYVQEMGVAVFEDSWVKWRLHLMLKGRGPRLRLLCFRGEQNCTLDFHAVGVPCPCGPPSLKANLLGAQMAGQMWKTGLFEAEPADAGFEGVCLRPAHGEGVACVSEKSWQMRQGQLVLRGR